jgi:hypothetical protein
MLNRHSYHDTKYPNLTSLKYALWRIYHWVRIARRFETGYNLGVTPDWWRLCTCKLGGGYEALSFLAVMKESLLGATTSDASTSDKKTR